MSQALWCDIGKHAYSANAEGGEKLSITHDVQNQWGGSQPFTVQEDICPDCALKVMPAKRPAKPKVTEAEHISKRDDEINARIAALEHELDMDKA